MQTVAYDTETALIAPGRLAPPLTCLSYINPSDIPEGPRLRVGKECKVDFDWWLRNEFLIVGHNVAYDMAVMIAEFPEFLPLVFKAYRNNKVTDTKIRQQLLDIAAGCYRGRLGDGNKWIKYDYTLDSCYRRATNNKLNKDGWRMFYGFFRDVPLPEWVERAKTLQHATTEYLLSGGPVEMKDVDAMRSSDPHGCIIYPCEDATATLDVYQFQAKHEEFLEDQYRQSFAAFCQHLTSCWGLRTDPAKVAELKEATELELVHITERLKSAGLVRQDGSRDTKKAAAHMVDVCNTEGKTIRQTEKGGICLDADACAASEDDLLIDYADFTGLRTVLAKDVPVLESGLVQSSFGLAESGRTTSAKPNIQNWRRANEKKMPDGTIRKLPDVRSCFVPRPGFVFAQADYEGLELRTLAQCCKTILGHSELGDALNRGEDPHTALAASILGIGYREAEELRRTKDRGFDLARQTSKVANFGFPGGLGPTKLCHFARKLYKVELTEHRARQLKEEWFKRWTEMPDYFVAVDNMGENVEQLFTRRLRGGCSYNAACNTLFQGLGSDCAKSAYCLISEACYATAESPLYGCRPVAFIHDEWILEVPDDERADPAARELARLMIEGANKYLPDVPATTEPILMRYWSKEAKPIIENGRLKPWPQ